MADAVNSSDDAMLAVEELSKKLSSEIARLEERIDLTSRIDAQEKDVAALKSDRANFEKQIQLYGSLIEKAEAVRQETRRDLFKVIAVGSALALVAGLVGIPTIKSYLARAADKQAARVSSVIDPLLDFQYAYSRGAGLLAARNFKAAVPFLMRCFKGHEYDPTILAPLLNALDEADDWVGGKQVLDRLQQQPGELLKIEDALTWNNLAVVETDVGVTDPAYLSLARQSLDRAAALVHEDDRENRRFILENFWILDVVTHRNAQAQERIKGLLALNDSSTPTWDRVRDYKVLKVHFGSDSEGLAAAGAMWIRIEKERHASSRQDEP
jgi:hypothetical protein